MWCLPQVLKKDDKQAMPTLVDQRKAGCLEIMFHLYPVASPHAPNDKADKNDGDCSSILRTGGAIAHDGVASLLLELGCQTVGAWNTTLLDHHNEHGNKIRVTTSGKNGDKGGKGGKGDADGNFDF